MSTVLNVKIDNKLKKEAQAAAKELGLPISTVVAAGLRDFVRTRTITISDAPRLKPHIEAELLEMSRQAKAGTLEASPGFDNLDEAFVWLDSEDDD